MAKQKPRTFSPRITNRRAHHDYEIHDKLEVGIALTGTEVKAIRHGRATLAQSFARVEPSTMELWLHGMDIGAYENAPPEFQHEPQRRRKLLAQRRQILDLYHKTRGKGQTLVPLALYFNSRGIAKVEIGVATGKAKKDKRRELKEKEDKKAMRQAMARKKIG
jgi:SsrA-binding protein